MSATDVTDGNSEEVARGGGGDDEAAWLDLIGRFDAPAVSPDTPAPWPERENLGGSGLAGPATAATSGTGTSGTGTSGTGTGGTGAGEAGTGASTGRPTADDGDTRPGGAAAAAGVETTRPGEPEGGVRFGLPGHRPAGLPGPAGPRSWTAPDEEDEHYIPPPPPPLPTLAPMAKGAWVALFGGPGYLLTATLAGWTVPGWALFMAIAAFIGGFVVLVLRLGDGPGKDSGPDDGAVI